MPTTPATRNRPVARSGRSGAAIGRAVAAVLMVALVVSVPTRAFAVGSPAVDARIVGQPVPGWQALTITPQEYAAMTSGFASKHIPAQTAAEAWVSVGAQTNVAIAVEQVEPAVVIGSIQPLAQAVLASLCATVGSPLAAGQGVRPSATFSGAYEGTCPAPADNPTGGGAVVSFQHGQMLVNVVSFGQEVMPIQELDGIAVVQRDGFSPPMSLSTQLELGGGLLAGAAALIVVVAITLKKTRRRHQLVHTIAGFGFEAITGAGPAHGVSALPPGLAPVVGRFDEAAIHRAAVGPSPEKHDDALIAGGLTGFLGRSLGEPAAAPAPAAASTSVPRFGGGLPAFAVAGGAPESPEAQFGGGVAVLEGSRPEAAPQGGMSGLVFISPLDAVQPTAPAPPPAALAVGWHPNPDDPLRQAYWNGQRWTRRIVWDGTAWVPDA